MNDDTPLACVLCAPLIVLQRARCAYFLSLVRSIHNSDFEFELVSRSLALNNSDRDRQLAFASLSAIDRRSQFKCARIRRSSVFKPRGHKNNIAAMCARVKVYEDRCGARAHLINERSSAELSQVARAPRQIPPS